MTQTDPSAEFGTGPVLPAAGEAGPLFIARVRRRRTARRTRMAVLAGIPAFGLLVALRTALGPTSPEVLIEPGGRVATIPQSMTPAASDLARPPEKSALALAIIAGRAGEVDLDLASRMHVGEFTPASPTGSPSPMKIHAGLRPDSEMAKSLTGV